MINIEYVEVTEESILNELLNKADETFKRYLGFEDEKENYDNLSDSRHKYWVLKIDNMIAGILYIYNYSPKFKKCELGYGLLSDYREKGYSTYIINEFCSMLEAQLGIVRIEVAIELTNEKCIQWFLKKHKDMGFQYMCEVKNYRGKDISCDLYERCIK